MEIPFLPPMSPMVHGLVLDNPCKVVVFLLSVSVSEYAFLALPHLFPTYLHGDLLNSLFSHQHLVQLLIYFTHKHTMPQPLV